MRFRDLGFSVGHFPTGPTNSLVDVPGVAVGHLTKIQGANCRSGLTAVLPRRDIFQHRLPAGAFVLNGAGELTGLHQIKEWGLLESPILLTNSFSVGRALEGLVQWLRKESEALRDGSQVVIPVVGECDDSFLHDATTPAFEATEVGVLLDSLRAGIVPAEGCVGGGTGMMSCDFKAGIGNASRQVKTSQGTFTLGSLLQNNFGVQRDLRFLGRAPGEALGEELKSKGPRDLRAKNAGSLLCVVATDAPLCSRSLERLAKRAALGVGRTGSIAGHNSGEFFLAFSTFVAHSTPINLSEDDIDALFEATLECTEEAVYNSLCAATDLQGREGRWARAVPLEKLKQLLGS